MLKNNFFNQINIFINKKKSDVINSVKKICKLSIARRQRAIHTYIMCTRNFPLKISNKLQCSGAFYA